MGIMMNERPIYITSFDKERLEKLLADAKRSGYRGSEYLARLENELDRAKVVSSKEIPPDVITMNSQTLLLDVDSSEEMTYTLVFPEDADILQDKISILAPIGTAMLGYRVGDVFEWPVPEGIRKIQVKEILYQPESKGDYHL
jgi:regulator of nucleoside diphosphate kinase